MVIEVVYDDNCEFILNIIGKYTGDFEIKTHNYSHHKEKKKAIPIMTENGSRLLPMITIKSEDLDKVFWSEDNPDWNTCLDDYLNQSENKL